MTSAMTNNKYRSVILICMALIIVTTIVFSRVGDHEFLLFDDEDYITQNPHIENGITVSNIAWAFSSVYASNWHPITWLSHMADVQLYGMNPRGHHFTNVIIHSVSTMLLFILLLLLTRSQWKSLFVAALFALHPMHVESVAWVAERKDVLSAFFWFLTLILYSQYVAKRKHIQYLLTLVSFILGLMCKPMLITLPIVMLLIDFWPLNRFNVKELESWQNSIRGYTSTIKSVIIEKIPFFACSLISAFITIYAQKSGGAINNLDEVSLGFRFENAILCYVKYIGNTFWPHHLAAIYPLPRSISILPVILSLIILLSISSVTIWARHKFPYLAVGWYWFLITLIPVIGLVQVGSQSMADRYTYIPLVGLFIMAAWGIPVLAKDINHQQAILASLAGAVIIASAVLTWQQLGYWRDDFSLFRHALQVTTGNYVAHTNLGGALERKGNLDAAISELQEALAINPNYINAHNCLGVSLAQKGSLDAAYKEFKYIIKTHPNDSQAHNNIGNVLSSKGEHDEAIKEYQEALRINPEYSDAYNNLAMELADKRKSLQ